MLCKCLLSCALLLLTAGPLLAHPISHPREIPGPVEEDQVGSPEEEMALTDQDFISHNAPGFGFPSLLPERNSLRSSDQSQAVREVLLERPAVNPLARVLDGRTDYRKRTTTDCFWKYCV